MEGFLRYEKLMVDWGSNTIKPLYEMQQFGQKPKPIDNFFEVTFKGFSEISNTVEALRLTQLFISLSPPRSSSIQKPEYLKYHVSVHLQEVYILKERLKTYATKIMRAYAKTSRRDFATETIKPLIEDVLTSLEKVVESRSHHVHGTRYSDEDLDRASLFSFVDKHSDSEEFEGISKISYLAAKNKWQELAKSNVDAIKSLLDHYFDVLFEVITENGEIYPPH